MKNEKQTVFCFPSFFFKCGANEGIKNSNKKSIKHENGGQLFKFRLSYRSKIKI